MTVERIISPSTDTNMKALLEVLEYSSTNKVTFFASPTSIEDDSAFTETINFLIDKGLAENLGSFATE